MNIMATHREDNVCVDTLADLRLNIVNFTFWIDLPSSLCISFLKDKLGIPSFMFSSL
jgi:hypothetical protein